MVEVESIPLHQDTSKEEYTKLLNQILRTDVIEKSNLSLEKAVTKKLQNKKQGCGSAKAKCYLSQVLQHNESCISGLQNATDSFLTAFMSVSEYAMPRSRQKEDPRPQLLLASGKLITLITESVAISGRIRDTSTGLHVAVDFLREPNKLELLNFSRSGRISIAHYATNEASTMCLTWLSSKAEGLYQEMLTVRPKLMTELIQTYKLIETSITSLKESSRLASQVFRVLMYCNLEGKHLLQKFITELNPHEVNDIISELETLRRQFDQIHQLLERLGWGFTDVWSKFSGKSANFQDLVRVSEENLRPFGHKEPEEETFVLTSKKLTPKGVKKAKGKVKPFLKLRVPKPKATQVSPYLPAKTSSLLRNPVLKSLTEKVNKTKGPIPVMKDLKKNFANFSLVFGVGRDIGPENVDSLQSLNEPANGNLPDPSTITTNVKSNAGPVPCTPKEVADTSLDPKSDGKKMQGQGDEKMISSTKAAIKKKKPKINKAERKNSQGPAKTALVAGLEEVAKYMVKKFMQTQTNDDSTQKSLRNSSSSRKVRANASIKKGDKIMQ